MKATFVRNLEPGAPGGKKSLFRVEPSVTFNEDTADHIVVSAIPSAPDTGMPETYIFPANAGGTVVDWGELPGSFQGAMDVERALAGGGFEVVS